MTSRSEHSERTLFGARYAEGEGQLAAAALCAAATLTLSGLWICYLLANLGSPGVAESAQGLRVLLYGLPTAAAAVLIHAHWPGAAPFGWALLVYSMAVILPSVAAAPMWLETPGPGWRGAVIAFEAVANLVKATLWYSLPLWFPEGRLSRGWWIYLGAVAVWLVPQVFSYAAFAEGFGAANPLAEGWWGEQAAWLSSLLAPAQEVGHFLLIGVSTAVLLTRIRRGEPRHRRHLMLLLGTYLLWAGAQQLYYRFADRYYWPTYTVFTAASALWAATVVYVVMRTGSWRISRSARRILAGLLVATVLTAVYVAAAAVLAGGLTPNRAADAVVLVALAFLLGAGLRRTRGWAMGMVDRLYYGDRTHPYQVLQTLAERISHAGSPQDIPATLCTTVVETLRLPGAALAVHTRAGPKTLARAGHAGADRQHFELLHHGTVIGYLSVSPREGEETLDDQDTGILSSLANQAAPALASLRLQEDLQTSREQIVTAREEERRSLRRDIHDGLGPALAGLRLRVDNAAARMPSEDPMHEALRKVSGDLGMAIKEVRRITDQLGPAPLAELGLSAALRQLAAAFDSPGLAVGFELVPSPLPPLPAAVEVAAYRIAAEALNNVLRHARARRADVQVHVDSMALTLTVLDDGVGIEGTCADRGPDAGGMGLRSMADRASEIGGWCTVGPLPHGTSVLAVLPRHSGPVLGDVAG
ncbi:histidine kinase [Streptomyces sp. NPDC051907]|uniref:sensor histidine kinase n=1 Tax=Streptomyces sp. NPDC051907 TaxID=3155284 RepID=UPI003444FF04